MDAVTAQLKSRTLPVKKKKHISRFYATMANAIFYFLEKHREISQVDEIVCAKFHGVTR